MDEDDVLVFSGDTLARLTLDYYPAVLHRPAVELMKNYNNNKNNNNSNNSNDNNPQQIRLSMPFFLRARLDGIVDSLALNSPKINHSEYIFPELKKPLSVKEIGKGNAFNVLLLLLLWILFWSYFRYILPYLLLDSNTTLVRDSWPWKKSPYYSSAHYTYWESVSIPITNQQSNK